MAKYALGVLFGAIIFVGLSFGADYAKTIPAQVLLYSIPALLGTVLFMLAWQLSSELVLMRKVFLSQIENYIEQIRWTFDSPERVGSHAEQLLEDQTKRMMSVISGRGRKDLRAILLERVAEEIAYVARIHSGNAAQLRFLKKTEEEFKTAYTF